MSAATFGHAPPWRARPAGYAGLAILAGAFAGAVAAYGYGAHLVALAVAGGALAVGLYRWEWSLYGLLLYLPFSGIAIIAMHENRAGAVLAKDILFVIPAYAGFFAAWFGTRRSAAFSRLPVVLLVVLGVLVLVQALNPALPNAMVALIGIKVWLLYVPMFLLGYHLIRGRRDLDRFLMVVGLSAFIPLFVGIAEAGLIYGGKRDLVYSMYGSAAAAVTQDFNTLNVEGVAIFRAPGLFSSFSQYFGFLMSVIAIAYAWAGYQRHRKWAWVARLLLVTAIVASLVSGARSSFLAVPVLLVTAALLDSRGRPHRLAGVSAGLLLGTVIALNVLSTSAASWVRHLNEVGAGQFRYLLVDALPQALETTVLGMGTGIDTNASRYAYAQQELFQFVEGHWYESWWIKVLLELGIVGLICVVALFVKLIADALRAHQGIVEDDLRSVSAALVAYLVFVFLYNFKAQYLDYDPINVYFWLFLGVLCRLPDLAERKDRPQPASLDPPRARPPAVVLSRRSTRTTSQRSRGE